MIILRQLRYLVAFAEASLLAPKVALDAGVRDERIKLLRFAPEPQPHGGPHLAARLAAQGGLPRARELVSETPGFTVPGTVAVLPALQAKK
jgi:hypothetical protein